LQKNLCVTLCLLRVTLCNINNYTENHKIFTENNRENQSILLFESSFACIPDEEDKK